MEQERLAREQEKTEEEVLAHFQRWAKNPQVRDTLCQNWLSPEERQCRVREIFGRPPERPAETETAAPESNPVKPGQSNFSPDRAMAERSPMKGGDLA